MEPRVEDAGEGCSGQTSWRAGTGTGSPGKKGDDLSLQDFHSLLKLLKITLPRNVLSDEIISKSRWPYFITHADKIVQKLQNTELRIALTPRLQCRTTEQAYRLKSKNKVQEFTEMIFFEKRKNNKKTLKETWEKILPITRNGVKMKDTYQEISPSRKRPHGGKMGNTQSNEKKCLKFFLRKNSLCGVRYIRERNLEYEFLSGRPDFLIKTNCGEENGTSENIIIECKSTKGDMVGKVFKPEEDDVAKLAREHKYYYQTQAYLYILKKTRPQDASVSAAMVIREHQEDEEDEEEDDVEYQEYKDDQKELKGEFFYSYVTEDAGKFEKLNNYCKTKALPLYLAVLSKIFEKEDKKE